MEIAAEGNEEKKKDMEDDTANAQFEERYIVPTKNGEIDEIVV